MTEPNAAAESELSISELIEKSRELGRLLWREWRVLRNCVAMTSLFGLAYAFGSRPEYSATTKVLPYRNSTGPGGLSGLAGLAGIRLPSGVADQTISAELYPVIGRTLDFRISVAETPLRFSKTAAPMTMIEYFKSHRTLREGFSVRIGRLRETVSSAFFGGRRTDTVSVLGANGAPLREFDKEYLTIVGYLERRLLVSIDKKTSVISITGIMPGSYAAADLVQTASDSLMQRIISYEARKAAEQLRFIDEQSRQSRRRYEQAQKNLAEFTDRNRMLASAVAQIERDQLQREYGLEFEVFQQLSQELERARIKKNEDTPVFTVLEQVVVPNLRLSPNRRFILMMSIFAGLALGVARVLYLARGANLFRRSATT